MVVFGFFCSVEEVVGCGEQSRKSKQELGKCWLGFIWLPGDGRPVLSWKPQMRKQCIGLGLKQELLFGWLEA